LAQDGDGLWILPVMDDMSQDIGIRTGWNRGKEIPALNPHAV
jgi:hypothetical protein